MMTITNFSEKKKQNKKTKNREEIRILESRECGRNKGFSPEYLPMPDLAFIIIKIQESRIS